MQMNFRFNLKTVAIVIGFITVIWLVSTCGCTHGGAYGLYEGVSNIANATEGNGIAVKTSVPVVAVNTKSKNKAKTKSNPAAPAGTTGGKATMTTPSTPAPVSPPATDKKGNASVSATASGAKEGYTNLMGYNNNNSTVNWGDPAPVANFVPPSQDNPLSYGELDMFANTPFKPECCPTTYSNSMGCACINKEQYNYLITRGGNNVPYAII